MLDLITDFVDYDGQQCETHRTSECVTHASPADGGECPYTRARRILDAYAPLLERRRQRHAARARAALRRMLDAASERRERARWEVQRDIARRYGGQHSPRGVTRPPLITEQQITPPPATYIPEHRHDI